MADIAIPVRYHLTGKKEGSGTVAFICVAHFDFRA